MTGATAAADVALLLLIGGAGFLLVARSAAELTLEETLGWSWGAGILFLAAGHGLLLWVGANPGPRTHVPLLLLLAVAAFLRRTRFVRPGVRYDSVARLLAALALAGAALYALQACAEPLWSTDFLAIWGLKAKTIYFARAIPARLFHDPGTPWSHPEYPFFVPLAMAAFSAAAGSWNDEALGLLYAAWQIATLLVIAGYCRRRSSARAGALAAALVAFWYPLYKAFNTGLAEIPFAFALVLLCAAVADGSVARCAVSTILCVATKQEGAVLVAFVALVALAALKFRRSAVVIAVAAVIHGLALRLGRGPLHDRDFSLSFLRPAHADELLRRGIRILGALFDVWGVFSILGILCLVGLFLAGSRSREDFLLVPLGGQLLLYLGACALSVYDPVWQLNSAFFRIAAALMPAVGLVLGCRIGKAQSMPAWVHTGSPPRADPPKPDASTGLPLTEATAPNTGAWTGK